MLSSLGKSLTSLIPRGPKALMAEYLASYLATYFDVDRDNIESNLLRDARIVLRNARLRPQRYLQGGAVVTTMGTVEEVIFSWKWFGGGYSSSASKVDTPEVLASASSGGGNLIQDATLTITGLQITLLVESLNGEEVLDEKISSVASDSYVSDDECGKGDIIDKEVGQGFRERYLQQIIDNLTLSVTDFDITIKLFPSGTEFPTWDPHQVLLYEVTSWRSAGRGAVALV